MSSVSSRNIILKRAYKAASPTDGTRVLVDRLWPRRVSKEKATLDRWEKDIAPSAELREWFGHRPERWPEFRKRYADELRTHKRLLADLRTIARKGRLTLVFSARDEEHNDAVVLRDVLLGR